MIQLVRPQPLRLSRKSGFNLQAASKALNGLPAWKVSRPSVLGNPFKVRQPGTDLERAQAAWLYGLALDPATDLQNPELVDWRARVLHLIPLLRGHNLACWCPLPEPGAPDCCHRAVLLRLANPALEWPPGPSMGPTPDGLIPPQTTTTPRPPTKTWPKRKAALAQIRAKSQGKCGK